MNAEYIYRVLRFFIVIGLTIAGIYIFFWLVQYTFPFIIAFMVSLFMNPIVNFLQYKVKIPRGFSVFLSILIILGIFAGMVTLLITELVSGANYLADILPTHINQFVTYTENLMMNKFIPFYDKIAKLFNNLNPNQQDTIIQNAQNVGQKMASEVGTFLQEFLQRIPQLVSWIPSTVTVLLFSLLATYFISKDWYRYSAKLGKFLPNHARNSSKFIFADLKKALFGYFKAQLILISITLVIVLLGLLVLKVKYAFTIAFVSGLIDILPYLGNGIIFVPWIIYECLTGDVSLGVGLAILYLLVIVQRQVMEPKILSTNIGINPLATLIAIFVAVKLLGVLGIIAGPVILVILTALNRANVFTDIWKYIKGKPLNNRPL